MSIALKRLGLLSLVVVLLATTLNAQEKAAEEKTYKVDPVEPRLVSPPRPDKNATREERSAYTKAASDVRTNHTKLTRAKSELYTGNKDITDPLLEIQFHTLINNYWGQPGPASYAVNYKS